MKPTIENAKKLDSKKKAKKKQTKKKKAIKKKDERFIAPDPVARPKKQKKGLERTVEKIKGLNNIDLGNGLSLKLVKPKLTYKKKW